MCTCNNVCAIKKKKKLCINKGNVTLVKELEKKIFFFLKKKLCILSVFFLRCILYVKSRYIVHFNVNYTIYFLSTFSFLINIVSEETG